MTNLRNFRFEHLRALGRPLDQAVVRLSALPVFKVHDVHIDEAIPPVGTKVGTSTDANETAPGLDKVDDFLLAGAPQLGYERGREAVPRDAYQIEPLIGEHSILYVLNCDLLQNERAQKGSTRLSQIERSSKTFNSRHQVCILLWASYSTGVSS
jgi:hypothetical protein